MSRKTISFTKMVGAGNDFIMIEAIKGLNYKRAAIKLCDRTDGIGADGLIILDKSKKADFRMRIFNADGSQAEMCGNGARCLASYIVKNKKPKKKLFTIETIAGTLLAQAKGEVANVRLSDPLEYKPEIPISIHGRKIKVHYIDTGVPHSIIYVDGLRKIDVSGIGPSIRYHKRFTPRGTNVNFVEQLKPGLVEVRTYERGVENETKACGTGSVAAALVSYLKANPKIKTKNKARMKVLTKSKEVLDVVFNINGNKVSEVWLKGTARFIAQGKAFIE